ncbi:MAG TPA: TonB-dependent receptor, partial [Alphaproteobacteria bacterium]|nr:TonB-dependent receptor [Alphaproteobacteria bacterium]
PRRRGALSPVFCSAALLLTAGLAAAQQPMQTPPVVVRGESAPGSLTVPAPEDAREIINRTPGGVEIVPAEQFRDTRATTPKDMLDFVPGVFAQPKFGEDSRLAIRGSGLSRNFHLRGLRLLQDGVPLNTADGSGDFQEIDPLAYRYLEVYKGANALQFGSAFLGGAVNFVTPTGYDFPRFVGRAEYGSFDSRRFQLGSGGVHGGWDYFVTPTWSLSSGFRDHSAFDNKKLNSNIGYRIDDATETRFYFGYNNIDQEVPSSVSKTSALNTPRAVAPINILNNYKRDIESVRLANRTTFLIGDYEVTAGAYALDRSLFHPIFQVIDSYNRDYGAFVRANSEGTLFGNRDRFFFGANLNTGTNDNKRFVNNRGSRGALTFDTQEDAFNVDLFGENQYFFVPQVALVTGAQVNHSSRKAKDRFLADGNDSDERDYNSVNPKLGLLWEVDRNTQVFGNVSRSSEPPSFSELNPTASPGFARLEQQKAVTAEIGTRGRREDYAWDVSLYRAWIKDELQLFTQGDGSTQAANADRTIHQGLELGFDVTVAKAMLAPGDKPDRLWWRNAYTYSDFRFDDDPRFGDNKLPGAPPHYLRSELRYVHPDGYYFGPNIEWVPSTYFVDNANTQNTEPYTLLGFKAGYTFANGLTVFFDGRNLTDEKYISNVSVVPVATPANSNVYFPGDGRALFAGIEYRW